MVAKRSSSRSFLNSFFYIVMSIMAVNFLILVITLVVLNRLGICSVEDYKNMLQVLVGNRQYVLSREQIAEYVKLKDEKVAQEKGLDRTEGADSTRQASAEALRDVRKQLEERINALRELRTDQEQKLADLRASIEAVKAEYLKERTNLEDWKKQTTKSTLSAGFQQMQKTLRAMEPDTIATMFTGNMNNPGGAEENARLIRQYLTPDMTAEVLSAMTERDVRQIVPLIEDKYSGMNPEAIAKAWSTPGTSDFKTPEQMAQYLRNMTVAKAFTIFLQLDPKTRAELVRLLKLPTSDDKKP